VGESAGIAFAKHFGAFNVNIILIEVISQNLGYEGKCTLNDSVSVLLWVEIG